MLPHVGELILVVLVPEPKHGYEIRKAIGQVTEGQVMPSFAATYGNIRRLAKAGYVSLITQETGINGQPRKVYAITGKGREYLNHKRRVFATAAATAVY